MWRNAFILLLLAASSQTRALADDCAYDPARTHMSRIIAMDSTNGPIYGQILNDKINRQQSRSILLKDHEVVLTFDDGPLPGTTSSILETLDKHCVKATFFSVGRMALASPKMVQEIERRGHTIGTHTWSHPRAIDLMADDDVKIEIEKGFAAVSHALGKPIAPFFRFPGLRDSQTAVNYMASRNISTWSVDVVSGDTEPGANPTKLHHDTLARLRALGRGVILFHDIKKVTAEALDGILTEMEHDGYKFVQVVSNTNYQPNADLIANDNAFKSSPETATLTGKSVGKSKEKLVDGSVDVMHTEWLDLKRASEKIAAKDEAPIKDDNKTSTVATNTMTVMPSSRPGGEQTASRTSSRWTVTGSLR